MATHGDSAHAHGSRELLGKASFAVTARIAMQLGRESISSSIVALIELVKNAYDADAENVSLHFLNLAADSGAPPAIVIEDDGLGMTRQQVEESWLVIGVDTKQAKNRSAQKSRVLTGEKGLGRLGLDRLCARAQVQTFTEDEPEGLEIDIDWTRYEGTHDKLESIEHDMYRIPKDIVDPVTGESVHKRRGTRLVLSGLKDGWTINDLHKLRMELALLVSPFGGVNDFAIYLYTYGALSADGRVVSAELLDAAQWKVVGDLQDVDGEYQCSLHMMSPLNDDAHFDFDPTPWAAVFPNAERRDPQCGPVRFEFYYITHEDVPELSLKKAQIDEFMRNNQGIRIYRDKIRVMPYGKPSGDGDWLGLAMRRTRSPGGVMNKALGSWKVGYNQVVGAVFIGRDQNPALMDQTNREGIVEGPAYQDMHRFTLWSIGTFERRHQQYVQAQGPAKPDELEQALTAATESNLEQMAAIEQMKSTVQSAVELLSMPTSDPAYPSEASIKIGEKLSQIVQAVSEAAAKQQGITDEVARAADRRDEAREQELQLRKDTLGNLASLGILATTFGHETQAASNLVVTNSNTLQQLATNFVWLTPDLLQEVNETVDTIVRNANKIHTFALFALTNVARDKRSRTKVFLDKVIRQVFSSLSDYLEVQRHIAVELDFAEAIPPLSAFSIDWESIIVNFVTNAAWALETTPASKRKIRVRLQPTDTHLTIRFADSGCGIAVGTLDSIFMPTFSTKTNDAGDVIGTGMGLAIVQSFVETYGGAIRVESPCDLGGAEFIVTVPIKAKG